MSQKRTTTTKRPTRRAKPRAKVSPTKKPKPTQPKVIAPKPELVETPTPPAEQNGHGMPTQDLTEKQTSVLDFIRQHSLALGYAPSYREISQQFDFTLNAVSEHLEALERKGVIRRTNAVARSIVVL
jgi:DNA-binding CsgD family transcriptional regulator